MPLDLHPFNWLHRAGERMRKVDDLIEATDTCMRLLTLRGE
jgi:hypothetical protein